MRVSDFETNHNVLVCLQKGWEFWTILRAFPLNATRSDLFFIVTVMYCDVALFDFLI